MLTYDALCNEMDLWQRQNGIPVIRMILTLACSENALVGEQNAHIANCEHCATLLAYAKKIISHLSDEQLLAEVQDDIFDREDKFDILDHLEILKCQICNKRLRMLAAQSQDTAATGSE